MFAYITDIIGKMIQPVQQITSILVEKKLHYQEWLEVHACIVDITFK